MRSDSMIQEEVIQNLVKRYTGAPINIRQLCQDAIDELGREITIENDTLAKKQRMKIPTDIPVHMIAGFMMKLCGFVVLCRTTRLRSRQECQVAYYEKNGENAGLYVTDKLLVCRQMTVFNRNLSKIQLERIYQEILMEADIVYENNDRDLIPVNNGVFDYKKKVLLPFSPNLVFTKKTRINYNPFRTTSPVCINTDGSTWNVEDWVLSLTDDIETTELLFQVCGAVLRPKVAWEQMILLYSTVGRNGKGTFCVLLRELAGEGNYASISLKQMTKRFGLSQLMDVSAVITDENSVSPTDVIKDMENLKAIVTADHIQYEKKYQSPVDFQYKGIIVQCLNWLPQISDTTNSLARRMLFIDFPKTFTGCDNKAIKADYLHRPEVLEYVLWKVLVQMPDYYEFTVPEVSKNLLATYQQSNNSVMEFWEDVRDNLVWDVCPGEFLYDLYKAWYDRFMGSSCTMGRNTFYKELDMIIDNDDEWYTQKNSIPLSAGMNDKPEFLIREYNLHRWINTSYTGGNPSILYIPLWAQTISSPYIHKRKPQPSSNPFNSLGNATLAE